MPYSNPDEHRADIKASQRKWYLKNSDRVKKRAADQKAAATAWLKEFRAKAKCVQCGEDHPATLDFHHIDPSEKDLPLADAAHRGWSIARLKREIEKCVVLCANCHRKLHYDERRLTSAPQVAPAE